MKKYRGIRYHIEKSGQRYYGKIYYNGRELSTGDYYFPDTVKALILSKIDQLKIIENANKRGN